MRPIFLCSNSNILPLLLLLLLYEAEMKVVEVGSHFESSIFSRFGDLNGVIHKRTGVGGMYEEKRRSWGMNE